MKKQHIKKIWALTMSAVIGLGMAKINPVDKVDARADGHYFFGMYDAEVSEYLNVREYANTWSKSMAKIPAGATFDVTEVKDNMGLVWDGYYKNGKFIKFSNKEVISGWVNLDYADENYKKDGGVIGDIVPDGSETSDYWKVDWISLRSQPNTYSTRICKVYPGYINYRAQADVRNDNMCYMYYNGFYGWVNLDYVASFGYVH